MRLLSFESSAKSAAVAITDGETRIAESFQNCGLTHSRSLLPMADALLANCGMTLSQMDGFAVASGPGSFTGIRIGIATVKGLALATARPVVGVSTLEAMAMGAGVLRAPLCCVMDARAGQVYQAFFDCTDGQVHRLGEDRAIKMEALSMEIGKKTYFMVGDGAFLCYNEINKTCENITLAPETVRFQSAYGVALAALPQFRAGQATSADALDALYLRRPQAERERLAKLKQESN